MPPRALSNSTLTRPPRPHQYTLNKTCTINWRIARKLPKDAGFGACLPTGTTGLNVHQDKKKNTPETQTKTRKKGHIRLYFGHPSGKSQPADCEISFHRFSTSAAHAKLELDICPIFPTSELPLEIPTTVNNPTEWLPSMTLFAGRRTGGRFMDGSLSRYSNVFGNCGERIRMISDFVGTIKINWMKMDQFLTLTFLF